MPTPCAHGLDQPRRVYDIVIKDKTIHEKGPLAISTAPVIALTITEGYWKPSDV